MLSLSAIVGGRRFTECDGHHIRPRRQFLLRRMSLPNNGLQPLASCSRKSSRCTKTPFQIREANNRADRRQKNDSSGLRGKQPAGSYLDQKSRHEYQRLTARAESKPMTGKVFRGHITVTEMQVLRRHPFRRSAVFWTIFTLAVLLWMIGLAASFGPGVMPLLLVLGTILAAMNLAFRRTSSN